MCNNNNLVKAIEMRMHKTARDQNFGALALLVFVFLFVFQLSASLAGTMTKIRDLNMQPDSHPNSGFGCSYKFSGTIGAGDFEKFKIDDPNQTIVVVCLDSPGGSFAEAVKIAEYFKLKNISTKLEAGSRCESACAIVFMAGTYYAHEVGSLHARFMHPTARLGFHVPALSVPQGVYDETSVTKAYGIAMRSMSEIIFKLIQKDGFEGGVSMKPALLGHMVSTPSDSIFMIDTVDRAGRWDIEVGPIRTIPNISDGQFYLACENLRKWQRDETAVNNTGIDDASTWVRRETVNERLKISAVVDEFNDVGCDFETSSSSPSSSDYVSEKSIEIPKFSYYPARTKLASIVGKQLEQTPDTRNSHNSSAKTLAGDHLCSVVLNGSVLETEPCNLFIRFDAGKSISTFVWPSGAKTVLIQSGRNASVNGAKNSPTQIHSDGTICAQNRNTGKHFCFKKSG